MNKSTDYILQHKKVLTIKRTLKADDLNRLKQLPVSDYWLLMILKRPHLIWSLCSIVFYKLLMYMSFADFILQYDWKYCDKKYNVIQLFCKLLETRYSIKISIADTNVIVKWLRKVDANRFKNYCNLNMSAYLDFTKGFLYSGDKYRVLIEILDLNLLILIVTYFIVFLVAVI